MLRNYNLMEATMKSLPSVLLAGLGMAVLMVSVTAADGKPRKSNQSTPSSSSSGSVSGTRCFWVYNGSPAGPGRWCSCGTGNCRD